jgi:hypothetical protein
LIPRPRSPTDCLKDQETEDQETEVKQVFHGCPYAKEGVTREKCKAVLNYAPPRSDVWGNGSIVPSILNLQMLSFMPRPLKYPGKSLLDSLCGPQIRSGSGDDVPTENRIPGFLSYDSY